jgi:murein DD-endopeptidase MepM/ murein hydrolase activator NlpD
MVPLSFVLKFQNPLLALVLVAFTACQNPGILVGQRKGPSIGGKQGAEQPGLPSETKDGASSKKSELETLNAWEYFAEKDFGLRDDSMGDGRFYSSRNGGLHSGIDYFYALGSNLKAPCAGKYFTGSDSSGYGNWIQVVCPIVFNSSKKVFVSLLFGHLQSVALVPKTSLVPAEAGTVQKGQKIGTTGNSGNAGNRAIQFHLHLEAALHSSENSALEETHPKVSGGSLSSAAQDFIQYLKTKCIPEKKIKISKYNVGTRVDPFLLFKCLSGEPKAATSAASGKGPTLKGVYSYEN